MTECHHTSKSQESPSSSWYLALPASPVTVAERGVPGEPVELLRARDLYAFRGIWPCLHLLLLFQGGVYLVNLLNVYGPAISILFVVFVEAAGVCWFYGVDRFSHDIEKMIGHRPGIFWRVCWNYISPVFLLVSDSYRTGPRQQRVLSCPSNRFTVDQIDCRAAFVTEKFKISGAFAKLRKATIIFVMSIPLPAWNGLAPKGWIFIKFDFRKSFEKIQIPLRSNNNNGYFTSPIYTCITSRSIHFRMKNGSDGVLEKIKTHSLFNIFFRK